MRRTRSRWRKTAISFDERPGVPRLWPDEMPPRPTRGQEVSDAPGKHEACDNCHHAEQLADNDSFVQFNWRAFIGTRLVCRRPRNGQQGPRCQVGAGARACHSGATLGTDDGKGCGALRRGRAHASTQRDEEVHGTNKFWGVSPSAGSIDAYILTLALASIASFSSLR
jgi:hypothetical protein